MAHVAQSRINSVHAVVMLALCVSSQSRGRKRREVLFRDLRRRLHDEICRAEWQRMVRMRHYVTLHCLKDPRDASWMDTWLRGTDENFITTTSLCR